MRSSPDVRDDPFGPQALARTLHVLPRRRRLSLGGALLGPLALATLAIAAAVIAGATGGRIVVAPDATVSGEMVRLKDVAALEGAAAEALGMLVLGPAPGAGESRTLEGAAVLAALRRAPNFEALTYTIPALVRVRRATQDVSEAAVRGIVERFLAEALGQGAGEAVLRTVEVAGPIRLPAGPYRARVIPPPGTPLFRRVRLQLEFTVDDRPVRTVWATADVGLFGPVVLARRPVARGEMLTEADLAVERRDLSDLPREVVSDLDGAVGRVARTPLVPYVPLRRDQLGEPAAVHRGDVVLLVAERGGLRITAPGEVREDAGLGQQVRVVNRTSRRDLVGRVLDPSTVAVEF